MKDMCHLIILDISIGKMRSRKGPMVSGGGGAQPESMTGVIRLDLHIPNMWHAYMSVPYGL